VDAGADIDGVIVAHGAASGGYAVFVKDRRLTFVHNLLGAATFTVTASVPLPAGRVNGRVVFTPTGRFQGDIELFYDDVPVGEGSLPRTTPVSFGTTGFSVGYQRGSSICDAYEAPFPIDERVLRRVVIDGIGPPHRDPAGEERVAMAQQ
jgi:hypothetical protein